MALAGLLLLNTASAQTTPGSPAMNVIELRNYRLKPGTRDRFTNYFVQNFIRSQVALGGYPHAQFKVKGADNNFFWIRGFADMASRSKFLPAFYYGPVWKQYGAEANSMLTNNDNVYLLKPLTLQNGALNTGTPFNAAQLTIKTGIAIIDFYTANTRLNELITLFSKDYIRALKTAGITNYSLWVSELTPNDFPRLPVFQDKNLLVVITFYRDERDYLSKQNLLNDALSEEVKTKLEDIVTIKNSQVLYPAGDSNSR